MPKRKDSSKVLKEHFLGRVVRQDNFTFPEVDIPENSTQGQTDQCSEILQKTQELHLSVNVLKFVTIRRRLNTYGLF